MSIRKRALTPVRWGIAAFLGACWLSQSVLAQTPQAAPLNPEFVRYLAAINSGQSPWGPTEPYYGLIPLPMDLSYLRGQGQAPSGESPHPPLTYDPVYDLRTLGRLTSVKDQNPYGTCWAFGTYGSLESGLLPAESRDFSENNLVNLAGFDWGFNSGGNAPMSMAYLARWDGPINETDDPYPNWGGSRRGLTVRKHVQQVRLIPPKTGATLNDEIKQVLTTYGAIDVSYYHNDLYYNSTYHSYCCPSASSGNHAVTLVGWDDNFSRSKFTYLPPGNGAYIVKNSWGTGWGESGYFYVSYYDARFANDAMFAFLNAEPTNNYARQYSFDPLGWVGGLGVGTTTFWGANVFTAVASENLAAVGFYAESVNTAYTLEIHTGVAVGAPRGGTLASSKSGTCSYPGYRTIPLDTPAPLTAGQRFSIVLKLTTPGYNYPQPFEYAQSGYSSAATAAAGQSYYSSAGSSWSDLTTFDLTANFCIKGFTAVPSVTLSIRRSGNNVILTWSAGVLQQADTLGGPYTDVAGAAPPSYTTTPSGLRKFYRLR